MNPLLHISSDVLVDVLGHLLPPRSRDQLAQTCMHLHILLAGWTMRLDDEKHAPPADIHHRVRSLTVHTNTNIYHPYPHLRDLRLVVSEQTFATDLLLVWLDSIVPHLFGELVVTEGKHRRQDAIPIVLANRLVMRRNPMKMASLQLTLAYVDEIIVNVLSDVCQPPPRIGRIMLRFNGMSPSANWDTIASLCSRYQHTVSLTVNGDSVAIHKVCNVLPRLFQSVTNKVHLVLRLAWDNNLDTLHRLSVAMQNGIMARNKRLSQLLLWFDFLPQPTSSMALSITSQLLSAIYGSQGAATYTNIYIGHWQYTVVPESTKHVWTIAGQRFWPSQLHLLYTLFAQYHQHPVHLILPDCTPHHLLAVCPPPSLHVGLGVDTYQMTAYDSLCDVIRVCGATVAHLQVKNIAAIHLSDFLEDTQHINIDPRITRRVDLFHTSIGGRQTPFHILHAVRFFLAFNDRVRLPNSRFHSSALDMVHSSRDQSLYIEIQSVQWPEHGQPMIQDLAHLFGYNLKSVVLCHRGGRWTADLRTFIDQLINKKCHWTFSFHGDSYRPSLYELQRAVQLPQLTALHVIIHVEAAAYTPLPLPKFQHLQIAKTVHCTIHSKKLGG